MDITVRFAVFRFVEYSYFSRLEFSDLHTCPLTLTTEQCAPVYCLHAWHACC
jgi:hypothetical protein